MFGTFDFRCRDCENKFEFTFINNSSDAPACNVCGSIDVKKLFSPPKAVGIGLAKVSINHELYDHPDHKPNPAKAWNKFGYNCQNAEDEGRTKKVDDNIELSVKAWKDAGYKT